MPPQLSRITSFNLDLEDWYSCHTSDDEAYQDALERNSVASFYTARGMTSTAASIVNTSIAIGSPSRLADADQALAEMVPEPIGDLRMQREPPELDEEDAPLFKRTRSIRTGPVASVTSPTRSSTPSTKTKAGFKSLLRRGAPFRPVATTTAVPSIPTVRPAQPSTPTAGPLRVCISVASSGVSVRLHILPDIFCFGDVPLPGLPDATTDYSAVLLGPEGTMASSPASARADQMSPAQLSAGNEDGGPGTPKLGEVEKLDVDCAVSLVTRPRGTTPFKSDAKFESFIGNSDPATPKDQTKERRQTGAKERERKAGGGFPGAGLFQRLFSGLRTGRGSSISNEGSLAPATVRELGSELLMASAAANVAELASAAQAIPVVAGFVQAAMPAAAVLDPVAAADPPVNPALPAGGSLDEAAAAAHRLSADIFRNVLRASAGGASGSPNPKAVLSPRDTAFPTAEQRHLQRDQTVAACEMTPARSPKEPKSASKLRSPGDGLQQSPSGAVALALLVGLAVDSADNAAPAAAGDAASAGAVQSHREDATAKPLAPNLSVEGLDCGGLPMPKLEQCESPVTVNAPHAAAASTGDDPDGIAVSDMEAPEEQAPADIAAAVGTPAKAATAVDVLATAEASPPVASPRTVSKRAFGTVARLVKKMAPDFSVSASAMQVSVCAPALLPGDAGELQQPSAEGPALVTEAAAACLVTLPVAGSAEPVAKSSGDSKEVATEAIAEHEGAHVPADYAGGSQASSGPEPLSDKDSEPAGQPNPTLFVFGQEQPKTAKHAKARSFSKKAATPLACDDTVEAPSEAAGRKRKGGDEILPNAKVPVTAERTGSNASQDIDSISASQLPAEDQAKPSSVSCDVAAGADPAPGSKPIEAASDAGAAEPDTAVVVIDAVRPEQGAASDTQVHETAVVIPAATAQKPFVSSDPAAAPPVASSAAMQKVAAADDAVSALARPPAAAAYAVVEPLAISNSSPAGEAGPKTDREPMPEAPAQADSKHSPSDMEKHDGMACTTSPGSVPAAQAAAGAGSTGAQDDPARPSATATTVSTTDVKGEPADSGLAVCAGHVAASDLDAVMERAAAVPASGVAAEPAIQVATLSSQPKKASVAHEAPVVLAPAPSGKEIEAVPSEVPSGAPVASTLAPDVSEPVAIAGADVKTPPTEIQAPTEAAAMGVQQQKPSEGAKHKRRGSFALFSCFRA